MDRKEKLGLFHTLLDERHEDADYALLQEQDPRNKIFQKPKNPVLCKEALFELLELVPAEEIRKNRETYNEKVAKEAARSKAAAELNQKEELIKMLDEGKLDEVKEIVKGLYEDHMFREDLVELVKEEEEKEMESIRTFLDKHKVKYAPNTGLAKLRKAKAKVEKTLSEKKPAAMAEELDEDGFPKNPELMDEFTKEGVEYEFTEKGWVEMTLPDDENEQVEEAAGTEGTASEDAKKNGD